MTGPSWASGSVPGPEPQRRGRGGEPVHEPVAGRADGDDDAAREAALAGVAERGAEDRRHGLVEVGVVHHDQVVLRPAERLDALAGARRRRVHVARDAGGADEAHRVDERVREQRLDGLAIAVDEVHDATRQAGLHEQLELAHRGQRRARRGLQHERVPRDERERQHPQRHHHREVERADARDDAHGEPDQLLVDPVRDLVERGAEQERRRAAGERDDLDPPSDLAARLGERLAVLRGDERGELLDVALEQRLVAEHDLGAVRDRGVGPGGERGGRGADRGVDVGRRRVAHDGEDAPGRRVEDLLGGAAAGHELAVDQLAGDGLAGRRRHSGSWCRVRVGRGEGAPLEEPPVAGLPEELAVLHEHLAALEDDLGRADHLAPLVAAVVDAHVVRVAEIVRTLFGSNTTTSASLPGRDRPLRRVQAEHLGGRRRDELDEAHRGDLPRRHAAVPQQRVAVLDAGQAVRDRGEVVLAEDLLVLVVEGAVVRGDDLEVVEHEPLPQLGLVLARAQRRRADELRALEAGPAHVLQASGTGTAGRSRRRRARRGRGPRAPRRAPPSRSGARCRRAPRRARRARSRGGSPRPPSTTAASARG